MHTLHIIYVYRRCFPPWTSNSQSGRTQVYVLCMQGGAATLGSTVSPSIGTQDELTVTGREATVQRIS